MRGYSSKREYDTIYVGYPIWWDNCPRLVQAFLKDYDLKGKTVIPFCTSGGSGIEGSMKAVRQAAKGANVLDGRDLTGVSESAVKKWVNSLDIKTPDTSDTVTPVPDEGSITDPQTDTDMKDGDGSRILVAYFSATGTTRPYAQTIAEKKNAELFEIVPEIPYTSDDLNYNSDCRANREQNDDAARPAISTKVSNMSDYDTVFIGYPIWWGTCPKIIDTFMESYDFTGKTIIPFCTSGSSSIAASETHIRNTLTKSTVLSGHRISGNSDLDTWLNGLSF